MRLFFPVPLDVCVPLLWWYVTAGIPSCYVLSDREFDGSNPRMGLVQGGDEDMFHVQLIDTVFIHSTLELKLP